MRKIETMCPEYAAEYLRDLGMKISGQTLRMGIEQGVFPFGTVIMLPKSPVYHIYKRLLDEWVEERSVEA